MPWPQALLDALAAPGRALGQPGNLVHPLFAAGHFLGQLSHRDNVDWQAMDIANRLKHEHGIPDHIATPAAYQYAHQQDIWHTAQQDTAVANLANALRQSNYRHRDF